MLQKHFSPYVRIKIYIHLSERTPHSGSALLNAILVLHCNTNAINTR